MNSGVNDIGDNISALIYQESMSSMKKILDLGEFKIAESNTKSFSYFKSQVMDSTYSALETIFNKMESNGILKKCSCGADLRKGWKDCECRGSGYVSQ